MTIICCDGETVAADSASNIEDQRYRAVTPKIIRKGGTLFGFFGTDSGKQSLMQWYLSGADPAELPQSLPAGWNMAVFHKRHAVCYNKEVLRGDDYAYPVAFGSGEKFATGAMSAGADAITACKIACKHSTTCGPPIISKKLIP